MSNKNVASPRPTPLYTAALCGACALALLWAYWSGFADMSRRWSDDPRYSHGYLVPVFALVLLWFRRDLLEQVSLRPNWLGLPFIGVGALMHLVGGRMFWEWMDGLSLMPTVLGFCVLLGGWPALRWAWPAIGFLVFMLPLPFKVEVALGRELQWMATEASTYLLQTIGYPALAEGNVIIIDTAAGEVRLGVVEACNGLSMMLTFFALSTAVAIVVDRPVVDRVVILLSAIPIAIASNVIRISATAICKVEPWANNVMGGIHGVLSSLGLADGSLSTQAWIDKVGHDGAGYLMMPVALLLLLVELKLLSWLFIDIQPRRPVPVGVPGATRRPAQKEAIKAPAV